MSTLSIRMAGFLIVMSMLLSPMSALAAPPGVGETIHVVQWGETLSLIASRYGVTVEAIMAANGLDNPNFIYVGQRLVIPTAASPVSGGCTNYYTVQWGDTLSGIACRYSTTTNALMQANDLYSDFIYQGQRLCVPPGGGVAPSPAPTSYYTVRPGDTLAAIAWRFGVSQMAIVQANNLSNPSFIYVGQRLLIPGVTIPTISPAPTPVGMAPAPPPGYQAPQATPAAVTEPALPRSTEPVVIHAAPQWVGSETAHGPDPDGITTLLVMTHEAKDLDVMIRSADGFVARGVTGVYYEYSWVPTFAFRDIPGGDYEVWIDGKPSRVVKAQLFPGHRALVEFKWKIVSTDLMISPAGWVGEVVENTSGIKPIGVASILAVRTGNIGNKIRVTAPGGYEGICITGTKLELGRGACEIGGLNAGTYRVILDGADIAVEVYLDGVGHATVEFRPG